MNRILSTFLLLFFALTGFADETQPLRVLAIGNSFSVDALEQEFHPLARAGGKEVIVGNLYFPGCSIEQQLRHLVRDEKVYDYHKIGVDGHVDTIPNATIREAIADEKWDIITFQQASHLSGIYDSYALLPALIHMVRQEAGAAPVFLWHMTWAYAPDSNHNGFLSYGKSQVSMYEAIVMAAQRALRDNPQLSGVIPAGTAIQNARVNGGDFNLTRDGYHLSLDKGRYAAACTWYDVLFNTHAQGNSYIPERMSEETRTLLQRSADDAVTAPFRVTIAR